MATLKEIAEIANVSISTVSRIINGDTKKPASKKTAQKVWEIINRVGYSPSIRSDINLESIDAKFKGNLKKIGCVCVSSKDVMNDPFFSTIVAAINKEANRIGFTVAYTLPTYDKSLEEIKNFTLQHLVDGIIIMGRVKKEFILFIEKNFDNIVYTGVNEIDRNFDEVICDSKKGIKKIVEYVIELGHTEIGFIGDGIIYDESVMINEYRYETYCKTLNENNVRLQEKYNIKTTSYVEDAYNAVSNHLKKYTLKDLPSVYVCNNDMVAIGAIKAFRDAGINVPEDISITGFDNVDLSKYILPPLTTLNIDKDSLGVLATQTLVDKINSNRNYKVKISLPFDLIERESCLPYDKSKK